MGGGGVRIRMGRDLLWFVLVLLLLDVGQSFQNKHASRRIIEIASEDVELGGIAVCVNVYIHFHLC